MSTPDNVFDKIAFYLVIAALFLAPVFFVPSTSLPFTTGKSALIILLSALAFFSWLVGRLKSGVYTYPKSWLYGSFILVLVVYALATVLSPNVMVSFFGQGLSIGSFAFIVSVLLLSFLIPQVVTGEKKIFSVYTALFISFFLVAIYEVIKLTTGGLAFGVLTSSTSNLVGAWNDLAIFAGLVSILSMIALDTLELSTLLKLILYAALVLSAALVAIAGFSELWIVLGLISLAFFIYQFSFKKASAAHGRNVAFHTLAVLLFSILFIFGGTSINNSLGKTLNVAQIEVRPSWSATQTIVDSAIAEKPLFGVGPERFSYEWLLHKPAGVNSTVFWSTNFNDGIGFVPTLVATIGIIGILGFLVYLVFLLIAVGKAFMVRSKTILDAYFLVAGISGVVYLWVLAFVYVSGPAIIVLTFAFSSLLLSTLMYEGSLSVAEFSVIDRPVRSFVSVLLTVLLLIAIVAFGYSVSKNTLASVYFGKAATAASLGNTSLAIAHLESALALSPDASYDRALTDVYLSEINNLINTTTQANQADAVKQLQTLLASAISSAQNALTLDPTDAANYLEIGKVYATVVPLKVQGSYTAARAADAKAAALSPQDPSIDLALAELDLANNDTATAETDINNALAKKADYADAIFLLSQIEINQGKVADAINAVKAVSVLSPNNPGVFFQLGLLQYSQKDYGDAITSLTQAIALSPQYANAEYFLGLSDYYNGDKAGAITQFTNLAKTNADNATVTAMLANLQAGKDPFAGQKATKAQSLPVAQ